MSEELILRSRAKVNIGLKIQNKRSDGLHNIHTLFQELDLHDTIALCRADSGCHFSSNIDWLDNSSDNLCVKAWMRMGELFDIKGISIHLEKIIPAGSGLGGGSSNAAAILKGITLATTVIVKTNQEHPKVSEQNQMDFLITLLKPPFSTVHSLEEGQN